MKQRDPRNEAVDSLETALRNSLLPVTNDKNPTPHIKKYILADIKVRKDNGNKQLKVDGFINLFEKTYLSTMTNLKVNITI